MGIASDLSGLKTLSDTLTSNKVSRFAYTETAYTNNDADGVLQYDVNEAQNVPVGTASVMKVNQTVIDKGYRARASSLTRMLINHFLGRVSYNLNKINDFFNTLLVNLSASLGTANGLATLDSNGRIPYSQLPESAVELKGYWNASTNTPTLVDGTGTNGDEYVVSVAGTQDLGSGAQYFAVGDRILYTSDVWRNIASGNVRTINGESPDMQGERSVILGANVPVTKGFLCAIFGKLLGKVWSQVEDTSTERTNYMAYGNGVWVCERHQYSNRGDGIYWSEDGKTWTLGTGYTVTHIATCLACLNGLWLCGFAESTSQTATGYGLWWSTNGKTWTQCTGDVTTYNIFNVIYADGLWVCCGQAGSSTLVVLWSEDGKAWTLGTGVYEARGLLSYANGIWEVAGRDENYNQCIYWSENGKTWTKGTGIGTTSSPSSIFYVNGMWEASAGDNLWWSEDGKTWTQGTGFTNDKCVSMVYANGLWVCSSGNTGGASSSGHGMWWSTDGKAWTRGTGGNTSYVMRYILYVNGLWVCSSSADAEESNGHGMWWSTDGKAWTQGTGNTTTKLERVHYANGLWVCESVNGVWYSEDGKSWSQGVNTNGENTTYGIAYANGIWLACASAGGTRYSTIDDLLANKVVDIGNTPVVNQ